MHAMDLPCLGHPPAKTGPDEADDRGPDKHKLTIKLHEDNNDNNNMILMMTMMICGNETNRDGNDSPRRMLLLLRNRNRNRQSLPPRLGHANARLLHSRRHYSPLPNAFNSRLVPSRHTSMCRSTTHHTTPHCHPTNQVNQLVSHSFSCSSIHLVIHSSVNRRHRRHRRRHHTNLLRMRHVRRDSASSSGK
eukprot:GHVU01220146.1.p1 GENE.GHVU01220146.1~~GHVU01220146.1.p1  ORF type:complete len:191 (-),score=11.12 GHVU01220146.1:289-861(-)